MSNPIDRPIISRWKRITRSPGLGFIPIALLLFLGADILIAQVASRRIAESPFRFARSSVALVDEIIDRAAGAPSPKAIFLGDSVVRGARSDANETLPVFFEKKLVKETGKPWTVFNLGLTAANNSDKLLLLRRLIDGNCRPDLIVIADNIKFYSRQYPVQTARYPKLATAAVRERYPTLVYRTLALKKPARKAFWAGPDKIATRLADKLFLVRNRDFIASRIGAGDHPFRRGLTAWNHIKRRFAAHGEKTADFKGYRRSYDIPELNLKVWTGVNMRALAEIQKTCDANELNCFFYLTPINVEKGYRENYFTKRTLTRYRNAVGNGLNLDPERNADLTNFIDESDFHDMDHPTLAGMKKLAGELAVRTRELAGATP